MGLQFTQVGPDSNFSTMKFFILAFVLATAAAIEDTADVKHAKAMFYNAFEEAKMGAHANKMVFDGRVQGPSMYLKDDAAVAVAKPHLADAAAVAAAKPYLADDAAVAAAKPYLADDAAVAAAKANFKMYFDARKAGIPATPGSLEPIKYAAPVAAPALYSNAYYASNYTAAPLTYAAYPTVAIAKGVVAAKPYLADAPAVAAAKPYLTDDAAVAAAKPYLADSPAVASAKPY